MFDWFNWNSVNELLDYDYIEVEETIIHYDYNPLSSKCVAYIVSKWEHFDEKLDNIFNDLQGSATHICKGKILNQIIKISMGPLII